MPARWCSQLVEVPDKVRLVVHEDRSSLDQFLVPGRWVHTETPQGAATHECESALPCSFLRYDDRIAWFQMDVLFGLAPADHFLAVDWIYSVRAIFLAHHINL